MQVKTDKVEYEIRVEDEQDEMSNMLKRKEEGIRKRERGVEVKREKR